VLAVVEEVTEFPVTIGEPSGDELADTRYFHQQGRAEAGEVSGGTRRHPGDQANRGHAHRVLLARRGSGKRLLEPPLWLFVLLVEQMHIADRDIDLDHFQTGHPLDGSDHVLSDVARDLDPAFDRAFRVARAAGVEVHAYRCRVDPEGVAVADPIPIVTPP